MKFKRSMALVLMTSCAAAVFAWAESSARKAAASVSRPLMRDDGANLVLRPCNIVLLRKTTPLRSWL